MQWEGKCWKRMQITNGIAWLVVFAWAADFLLTDKRIDRLLSYFTLHAQQWHSLSLIRSQSSKLKTTLMKIAKKGLVFMRTDMFGFNMKGERHFWDVHERLHAANRHDLTKVSWHDEDRKPSVVQASSMFHALQTSVDEKKFRRRIFVKIDNFSFFVGKNFVVYRCQKPATWMIVGTRCQNFLPYFSLFPILKLF